MLIRKAKIIASAAALVFLLLPNIAAVPVQADQFDDQINALKAQINQNQAAANALAAQADTLKNKLAQIQEQISAAQTALSLTKTQIVQTQAQIDQANLELDKQKQLLRDNIRLAQQQGEITPLEVLASSRSLSDYMTKQEFLKNIQKKINDSLKRVASLKKELEDKNNQLGIQRNQQQAQVNSIAAQQAEQNSLLSQTQGQESAYQNLVATNKSQLNSVIAARAAAIRSGNLRVSGGGCGPYPDSWCHAAQDSLITDGGYFNRECVSYVAWRRETGGYGLPNQWGNAYQWAANINSGSPSRGAIAVWRANANPYVGGFGHVAYVESVDGGGINISQYNFDIGGGEGLYSTMYVPFGSTMWGGIGFIR